MALPKLGDGEGSKAVRGFAKLLAVIIILSVSAFGDVMYIIEVQKLFVNQGMLVVFCYIGGIAGFMSVCYLLIGKSAVFRPGGQMLASWLVFGMELVIVALNIMYVFSSDHSGVMGAWGYLSPATPVLHMLGVAIVYYLDPELKEKHRELELEAKLAQVDRDYRYAVGMAKVQVKTQHLDHAVRALASAGSSDTTIAAMQEHAQEMNDSLITEVTGKALPAPKSTRGEGRYGRY